MEWVSGHIRDGEHGDSRVVVQLEADLLGGGVDGERLHTAVHDVSCLEESGGQVRS